jgi:hypothetical protein
VEADAQGEADVEELKVCMKSALTPQNISSGHMVPWLHASVLRGLILWMCAARGSEPEAAKGGKDLPWTKQTVRTTKARDWRMHMPSYTHCTKRKSINIGTAGSAHTKTPSPASPSAVTPSRLTLGLLAFLVSWRMSCSCTATTSYLLFFSSSGSPHISWTLFIWDHV